MLLASYWHILNVLHQLDYFFHGFPKINECFVKIMFHSDLIILQGTLVSSVALIENTLTGILQEYYMLLLYYR